MSNPSDPAAHPPVPDPMSPAEERGRGIPLHWKILIGLVIGALIGLALGHWAIGQLPDSVTPEQRGAAAAKIVTSTWAYAALDLVGDLFIAGLKMIIVPLVVSSIVLAIANMGYGDALGRLSWKTLAFYVVSSLVAIVIGLTLVNVFKPGVAPDGTGILQGKDLSSFQAEQKAIDARTEGKSASDFLDTFRQMVPDNLIKAAADGQLLGLITAAILIGIMLGRYRGAGRETLFAFTNGVYDLSLGVTNVVLAVAPIGVVGLLGATVAEQYAKLRPDGRFAIFGFEILKFAGIAFAGLLIHFTISMSLALALLARVNPWRHYKAMAPALATAFSTASSSATLPVTIECVEDRCRVSRRVASFTLPLGATVNMNGTALYECASAMFICFAFGVHLSFAQQFFIVLTALLTSIGVAGVPAASLVAIVIILQGVESSLPDGSLPAGVTLTAGMGLLFVFDRPLDMLRTAVNIFSDSVAAVVVARSEGETQVLQPVAAAEV